MKQLILTTLCFFPLMTQATTEGILESANCTTVAGWAWDSTKPDTAINVDIYDGSVKLTTITAGLFRQDLANKGNGKHGFQYSIGSALKNGATHQLSVKFNASTQQLSGSPKTTAICIGELNDTGWQKCSNGQGNNNLTCPISGFNGQDAEYGRDAKALSGTLKKTGGGNAGFDFTKIANDGTKLPASATLGSGAKQWACTLDNFTGLLWEVKSDAFGLRYKIGYYSWYNPDAKTNGGSAGTKNGGSCSGGISCDTDSYVKKINSIGLCGKKNWRLPKQEELRSLINYGTNNPAIDSNYFPNTQTDYGYWSASPVAYGQSEAWSLNFYNGDDYPDVKSVGYYILLVNGNQ